MNHDFFQECQLPLGHKDAAHLPFIVSQLVEYNSTLNTKHTNIGNYSNLIDKTKPGAYVKFLDETCKEFIPCERDEAHGIINFGLTDISIYDKVVIFLLPGFTSPVTHNFSIDFETPLKKKKQLEEELKTAQENNPECTSCWDIVNGRVIRW